MTRTKTISTTTLFATFAVTVLAGVAGAEGAAEAPDEKHISGMSILGNDESPKSLVIVPWKSSDLGGDLNLDRRFGEDRAPLDPDVLRRSLDYHAIRSERADR